MQRSIAEAEERMEHKMAQHTERKITEVHQRLDAFKLRVLARPAPPVDMSTLQAAVESLREDIDMILEARVPESKAPSAEEDETRARKKERHDMEATRRASIAYEEARQIRAVESAAWASSSRDV